MPKVYTIFQINTIFQIRSHIFNLSIKVTNLWYLLILKLFYYFGQ